MSDPIDFDGINQAALCVARSLLPELIPGGEFHGSEYIVRNPRRDDQQPGSFKINYKTGVWKDFASGDGGSDVNSLAAYIWQCGQSVAALQLANKLGVPATKRGGANAPKPAEEASLPAPKICRWGNEGPPIRDDEVRRHPYRGAGNTVLKLKIKYRAGKFVTWYRVFEDGKPVGWQAKKPANFEAVPYVTGALNPFDPELKGDQILWPEGEKDIDTLSKLNLPAFTFGGTGDGLPDGIESYLKDRHIVILADNDDAGRNHAEKKADLAHHAGATSIRIVHFPELPAKGDVSDYMANGGTRDSLLSRIDAASILPRLLGSNEQSPTDTERASGLIVQRASDIKPEPISWLWPERIAIGKLTLIVGDPGLGKSQLTAFLTAVVTTGDELPCREGRAEKGSVLIFSAEDDAADTIVPRLQAAGADLDRVHIVSAVATDDGKSRRMFHLEKDLAHLEAELIKMRDTRLVIIDPITAYLGGVDTHRNSDVRGVLGLVADLAARHRVAVVAISHWNKTGAGIAINRVTGSGAFVAAVRAAFMVAKDPDDDSDTRRLFVPIKNNLAPMGGGLAFRLEQHLIGDIVASAITWENEKITQTADEILAAAHHDSEQQSVLDEATDWLKELLAEGPVDATQVCAQAAAAGLAWATVRRAKNRIGIKPQRRSQGSDGNGKWIWALPSQGLQDAQEVQETHAPSVSNLEEIEPLAGRESAHHDSPPGAA
jgi:putative DNA primase/helicase